MPDDINRKLGRFVKRVRDLFDTSVPAVAPAPRFEVRPVSLDMTDTAQVLRFARQAPLVYGYWGDFKRIYKQAENSKNYELLAPLCARLDAAPFPKNSKPLDTPLDAANIGPMTGLAVSRRGLYLTAGQWTPKPALHTVNVENAATPSPVQKFEIAEACDIAVDERAGVVLSGSHYGSRWTVHTYRWDGPAPPEFAHPPVSSSGHIAIMGSYAVALTGGYSNHALEVFDIFDLESPKSVGRERISSPVAVAVQERLAFVLTNQDYNGSRASLHVYDLSDPTKPRSIANTEIRHPTSLAISGDLIYVTSGGYGATDADSGLSVFAWRNGKLTIVAHKTVGNAQCVVTAGNYAYVGMGLTNWREKKSGGVRIFDVSRPNSPQEIAYFPTHEVTRLALRGDALFFAGDRPILRALDVSDPAKPLLIGVSPSRETLGYMKRRTRRVLRELPATNPEFYTTFVSQMLSEPAMEGDSLDPATQWLAIDALFGGGGRWTQTSNNRGGYKEIRKAFIFRTREERHPELWDNRPELLTALYANAKLPYQIRAFALKVLLSQNVSLPVLDEIALAKNLRCPSALLISYAARQIATALDSGEMVSAELTAEVFYRGTARHRRTILNALDTLNRTKSWLSDFAKRLFTIVSANVADAPLTRKQDAALMLLATRFPDVVRSQANPRLTVRLYETGRPEFTAFAENIFANVRTKDLLEWLTALQGLNKNSRERAFAFLLQGIATQQIFHRTAFDLLHAPSAFLREAGWRLLANSATANDVLEKLWDEIFGNNISPDVQITALSSPSALSILARISFDYEKLRMGMAQRLYLLSAIGPGIFALMVSAISLDTLLEFITLFPADQWLRLRSVCIEGLRRHERGAAFWQKVFDVIGATGNAELSRRLLDDPQMVNSFLELSDIGDLLKSGNPAFGPFLARWVDAHLERFTKDSPELLALATHFLPEIREVGITRVQSVGMSLPFALRLLESELPPSVALGRTFFEFAEPAQELELAVALCDSPQPSVRSYGLAYVEARKVSLNQEMLFSRLSENPDATMQGWVAENLRPTATQTNEFDRVVLRVRNKARRAKETVKAQLMTENSGDISLLLEMARSRTPRDAEWALQQLAKLALAGVEIPDVTLEGVAGV